MSQRLYKQAADTSEVLPTGNTSLPLDRPVAVYYRQSTEAQVGNISTTIQTVDMVEELVRRGWDRSLVVLIDMDQGVSGTTKIDEREGMRTLFSLIIEQKIGAVACQDEDRLFRDITQIQVNIFIEACRTSNVLVLTPSMVYDFANEFVGSFHARQFRFKSEMAAEYINSVIKGKLQKAKRRLLLEGRWGGAGLPPGYMIDTRRTLPNGEKNEAWRRFAPFEPFASVVREYFRLFLSFNGQLRTTFRHIQLHGPWYPDPASCSPPPGFRVIYKMHRYDQGYCPGRVGLRQLLTNATYLGHWIFNDVVVQWNNHQPLIDEETFFRAYNYLCPVLIDGTPNAAYNPIRENARPSLEADRGQDRPLLSGLLVAYDGSSWRNVGTRWNATNNHYVYELRTQHDFNEYEWSRAATHVDTRVTALLREKLKATFDTTVWERTLAGFADALDRERRSKTAQLAALDQVMKNLLTNLDLLSNQDMIRATEKRYSAAKEERDRLLKEIALLSQENQSVVEIRALQVNSAPALENWPDLSREDKQSVIHAFVDRIEISRIEKYALSITICWRDDSRDQFVYASPNTGSTVWLKTEIEQLMRLVEHGTQALELAAAFPDRTWGAISQKVRQTSGPNRLRLPFDTIGRTETYNQYTLRLAEDASQLRVLKPVVG